MANKFLRHLYGPLPKGTFDNEEVDEIVGDACERMSLKEAAKADLLPQLLRRPPLRWEII